MANRSSHAATTQCRDFAQRYERQIAPLLFFEFTLLNHPMMQKEELEDWKKPMHDMIDIVKSTLYCLSSSNQTPAQYKIALEQIKVIHGYVADNIGADSLLAQKLNPGHSDYSSITSLSGKDKALSDVSRIRDAHRGSGEKPEPALYENDIKGIGLTKEHLSNMSEVMDKLVTSGSYDKYKDYVASKTQPIVR